MCRLIEYLVPKFTSEPTRFSRRSVRAPRLHDKQPFDSYAHIASDRCLECANEKHSIRSAPRNWRRSAWNPSPDSDSSSCADSNASLSREVSEEAMSSAQRQTPPDGKASEQSSEQWVYTPAPTATQYTPFIPPASPYQMPAMHIYQPFTYPCVPSVASGQHYPAFIPPVYQTPLTASLPYPTLAHPIFPVVPFSLVTPFPLVAGKLPPRDPSTSPVWPPEQVQASLMNPLDTAIFPLSQPLVIPRQFEGGTFPPQPLGCHIPVRIHTQLVLNSVHINDPVLQWDIVQPPELSRALSPRRTAAPASLNEPAVTPGAKNVYITTDWDFLQYWMDPKRWGPIILQKEKDITVLDLLNAIYTYFQQPLTKKEEKDIKAQPGGRENLKGAWKQRIHDSYRALPPVSAQSGYLRSDVVGRFRRWQGVRAVVFANGSWKLYLRLLPGPVPDFFL